MCFFLGALSLFLGTRIFRFTEERAPSRAREHVQDIEMTMKNDAVAPSFFLSFCLGELRAVCVWCSFFRRALFFSTLIKYAARLPQHPPELTYIHNVIGEKEERRITHTAHSRIYRESERRVFPKVLCTSGRIAKRKREIGALFASYINAARERGQNACLMACICALMLCRGRKMRRAPHQDLLLWREIDCVLISKQTAKFVLH